MTYVNANKNESNQDAAGIKTDRVETPIFDNRESINSQRGTQLMMQNRPQSVAQRAIQNYINTSPITQNKTIQRFEHERDEGESSVEPLDAISTRSVAANFPEKPNDTGLPNNLKAGIEALSGISMDHVKVHYNSDNPSQLNAHAYAQGSDIHIAPGQEKHLPHEAWHVAQQAQGRVKPTMQMKGNTAINDDTQLETEADVMGATAANMTPKKETPSQKPHTTPPIQRSVGANIGSASQPVQKMLPKGSRQWTGELNAFKEALGTDIVYDDLSNQTKILIGEKLTESDKWSHYNLRNPRLLSLDSKNNFTDFTKIGDVRKWIKALEEWHRRLQHASGFAPDHSSSITPTTTSHDRNWVKWLEDHVDKISINKMAWPNYDNDLIEVKKSAAILDGGSSIGDIYQSKINEVKRFAEMALTNKTNASQGSPVVPGWTLDPIYGSGDSVKITYTPGYSMPAGSGGSITTPIDQFYTARKYPDGKAMWVKGHLLNDHAGGPAKHYNIAPLEASLNIQMEKIAETTLKSTLEEMIFLRADVAPQKYKSIDYAVQLGPQMHRGATQQWKSIALNVKTKFDNDRDTSTLDEAEKTVIDKLEWWSLSKSEIEKRSKSEANLWEMEDQLVRDWAIKLVINYDDDSSKTIYHYLPNTKHKIEDPVKSISKEESVDTIKSDEPLTTTLEESLKKSVFLEARLANLSEQQYQFIVDKLQSDFLNLMNPIPQYDERNTLLANWNPTDPQLKNITQALIDIDSPSDRRNKQRVIIPRFIGIKNKFHEKKPTEKEKVELDEKVILKSKKRPSEVLSEPELPSTPNMSEIIESEDQINQIWESQKKMRKTAQDEEDKPYINEFGELEKLVHDSNSNEQDLLPNFALIYFFINIKRISEMLGEVRMQEIRKLIDDPNYEKQKNELKLKLSEKMVL